jgi:hypothetical protein
MSAKTTSKKTKKNSTSSSEDELHIHFPKDEDWKDLKKSLRLSKKHAQILLEVPGDIVMDIAVIKKLKKAQVKRSDAIRRIQNLELRLEQTIKTLRIEGKQLTEILPLSALEDVGNLFTFAAASSATEKNLYPKDYLKDRQAIESTGTLMTLQAIDQYYATRRRDLGLLHGADLLIHALEKIHLPLKGWLERNTQNVGGRPKQSIRELAIQRLIHFAPAILGSKPTPSVTGPFMTMATLSLYYCGFPEDGLEKAIANELRKWKAFNEAGEEPKKRKPKSTKALVPKP